MGDTMRIRVMIYRTPSSTRIHIEPLQILLSLMHSMRKFIHTYCIKLYPAARFRGQPDVTWTFLHNRWRSILIFHLSTSEQVKTSHIANVIFLNNA